MGFQKINEILEKQEYKDIVQSQKERRDKGVFEFDESNIFGTGTAQAAYNIKEMKLAEGGKEDEKYIAEFVKNVPFRLIAKEFLSYGSTASGASNLVPTKIYQILQTYASPRDIINDVSSIVIPAEEIPGRTLDIPIAKRGHYVPKYTTSGGKAPEEELGFTKATLTFDRTLTVNFNIGNDLVEDTPQLSLIELHVRMAGAEMGKKSTTEILTVMATSTDGDGTLNTKAATEDGCTLAELWNATSMVILDEFIPDYFLAPSEMWISIMADTTVSGGAGGSPDFHNAMIMFTPNKNGDPFALKWIRCEHGSLWTDTSGVPTDCIGYVFTKDYSYISGRKRWMRLENYSDPIRDLAGAVITSRQDTVSIYNDATCKISE